MLGSADSENIDSSDRSAA